MLTFSPAPVSIFRTDHFLELLIILLMFSFLFQVNVFAGIDVVQCSFVLHGLPGGDGGHSGDGE